MVLMMLAGLALGQTTRGDIPDLNGQLFRPSLDGDRALWANESMLRPTGTTTARAMFHYAHDPVVYVDPRDNRTELVSDLFQANVMVGHTRGPVRLGVDVPVYLRTMGAASGSGGETGLGDITPDLKVRLRDGTDGGIGLAAAARVALPTATVDAPLANGGLGYEIEGILDGTVGKTLLVANLGLRGVPTAELENAVWDDALSARLGAGYALSPKSGLSLEVAGLLGLRDPGKTAALPAEALLGAYSRLGKSIVVRGGAGTGITPGIGAPQLRVILGLGYEPSGRPKPPSDIDGDGIVDKLDQCPEVSEDFDGFQDEDGCAEPTRVTVRVIDAAGQPAAANVTLGEMAVDPGQVVELPMGPVRLAAVAPGTKPVARSVDIPGGYEHEIVVQLEDDVATGSLLVKAVDADGNPVPDAQFALSGPAERTGPAGSTEIVPVGDYDLVATAPGYRPAKKSVTVVADDTAELILQMYPAKVIIEGERIDLQDSVFFNTAKATIKPVSFELLDEVAETLIDHPELTKVRIEGHTDSRGSAAYNLDLSKRRAASVRQYLISKGVEAERLESEGYGETRPLNPENNERAWAVNRRVDFYVLERSDD